MARGRPQATWQSREDCGTGLAARARCTAMARACPRVGGREGRKAAGGRGLEPGDLQAPGGLLTTSAASPTAGTCKVGSLEPSGQLKREAELCWQLERARHSALPALCFFIALLQPQGRRRASLCGSWPCSWRRERRRESVLGSQAPGRAGDEEAETAAADVWSPGLGGGEQVGGLQPRREAPGAVSRCAQCQDFRS